MPVERLLAAEPRLILHVAARSATLLVDKVSLGDIPQPVVDHQLQLALEVGVVDGSHHLDPPIQVSTHPVCGTEEVLRLPSVAEDEDPRVLQVTVDDRIDVYICLLYTSDAADE